MCSTPHMCHQLILHVYKWKDKHSWIRHLPYICSGILLDVLVGHHSNWPPGSMYALNALRFLKYTHVILQVAIIFDWAHSVSEKDIIRHTMSHNALFPSSTSNGSQGRAAKWNSLNSFTKDGCKQHTHTHRHNTSVDAGASLGASLRELASEAAAVCVHS